MRVCLDCPTLIPRDAYKGRCSTCNRKRDAARGTRQERGYDAGYDRERRYWEKVFAAGLHVTCWRCGEQIADEEWHLGHDDHDRSVVRGPEHARRCNLSAAGRASKGTL